MSLSQKRKIFYWSPCLTQVGTVISTKNSAIAMANYKKKNFDVYIINACGEWNNHKSDFNLSGVHVINLNLNYFWLLPKEGYFSSRFSYIIIFLLSFFPLLIKIRTEKPDYFIMHLITSLPIFLLSIFKFNTKFILRISGFPKLNIIRKFLWKIVSKKIYKITCPTKELKSQIIEKKIFAINNIFYLQDAIINLKNFTKVSKIKGDINGLSDKIILAVGRLTHQKNFIFLIKEFKKFSSTHKNYSLIILGDGEQEKKLKKIIKDYKIEHKVYLQGRVSNVYDYMRKANVFVLSSLWEELGFVLVEAAFNNLFIISSDCPNGPKEFIDQNKCGILFKNNESNSLLSAFRQFDNIDKSLKKERRINAKRKSKIFTKFNHHKTLLDIL